MSIVQSTHYCLRVNKLENCDVLDECMIRTHVYVVESYVEGKSHGMVEIMKLGIFEKIESLTILRTLFKYILDL